MDNRSHQNIELVDGSCIAVIGGGPSGSFFSYFALEFANRFDLEIDIDIYEAKNFSKIEQVDVIIVGVLYQNHWYKNFQLLEL